MINLFNDKDLSLNKDKLHGHIEAKFCVTSGEKCKVIGIQDGTYPDFGHHVSKEMGGIWVHPIKLMDGFWSKLDGEWLIADKYQTLPYANKFYYDKGDVQIERFQFVPDEVKGFITEYTFTNGSDKDYSYDFETVFRFDISPVWFSENIGIKDDEDKAWYDDSSKLIIAKDVSHDWYASVDCSAGLSENNIELTPKHIGYIETAGNGYSAKIQNKIEVKANSKTTISFYISGSWHSEEECVSECKKLKENHSNLLAVKKERYTKIKNTFALTTSDVNFDKMYEWVKYNNDWMIQDSDEFGRAPVAGIPEYTWWFGCDNSYSLQGILALGDYELVKSTLKLIHDESKKVNGNGRILHELTTFGAVSNPGNTQETAHYITAVYKYLQWTGDTEIVKELYPYCKQGIDWLMEMDDDGDLLPSGYGIIEIQGLNVELIDTAVYTCQALFNMYEMSKLFGDEDVSYLDRANRLRETINSKMWNDDENLYVDAVGKVKQILERIPLIREQFSIDGRTIDKEYEEYLNKQEEMLNKLDPENEMPFTLNKNWVINTPIETMIADKDKAYKALEAMDNDNFIGEYGMYLSAVNQHATMTISTGVQAVSEGRYKRVDKSLVLIEKMLNTMGVVMPGAISEMSPDYGCFVQEWTIYALMVPIVECFLGLQPDMVNNKIILSPCIPKKWDRFEMKNVIVGKGSFDFGYQRSENKEVFIINSQSDCKIHFELPTCNSMSVNGIINNSKSIILSEGSFVIEVTN